MNKECLFDSVPVTRADCRPEVGTARTQESESVTCRVHGARQAMESSVPRRSFPVACPALRFLLLRSSGVATVAKGGCESKPNLSPRPGSLLGTQSTHSPPPNPASPPPTWSPRLWRGSCRQTRLSLCATGPCQLVVRPWMPKVTNYRSPHPVAEGISLWERIPWMSLAGGLETPGLPRASGRESWSSWHLPICIILP